MVTLYRVTMENGYTTWVALPMVTRYSVTMPPIISTVSDATGRYSFSPMNRKALAHRHRRISSAGSGRALNLASSSF
jgi:hypothetical protein